MAVPKYNKNNNSHITDLSDDLKEISRLQVKCKRPGNAARFRNEIKRINQEIALARNSSCSSSISSTSLPQQQHSGSTLLTLHRQSYPIDLTNFTFQQSNKFAKVFVCLEGVGKKCTAKDVSVLFTERTISMRVIGLDGKDYALNITNLLHDIVPSSSFYRIKKNVIVISAHKADVTIEWAELTTITQRMKELKDSLDRFPAREAADLAALKDPMAGHLMFMRAMQRVYQTGDPELRRKIEQGCCYSQD